MKSAPHVIPYQGSKRKLAESILGLVDFEIDTLYEPFVGSGAITLAAAANGIGKRFEIADKLEPLIGLWRLLAENPSDVHRKYSEIWNAQLSDPATHFRNVRDSFNEGKDPVELLYLVARCVKNAVRFNNKGEFNQGPDNRRLGLHPEKLERESLLLSKLLKDRVKIFAGDFRDAIGTAGPNDLIYMDPPWQGTSGKRDPRYAFLLNIDELIEELHNLNRRHVPFMLSFDGSCGDRSYGERLPDFLNLDRIGLNAGRSSQATLLGRNDVTIESLYLSPAFMARKKAPLTNKVEPQRDLFDE